MTTAAIATSAPTLPRAWRGEYVHVARFAEPVAILGDLHGRADLLSRLVPLLGHRPLLVTGDVGDRGPDTRGVIDVLVARGAIGVLGNHDLWLAAWAAGEGFDRLALAPGMGGAATLASYGVTPARAEGGHGAVPHAHTAWLLGLHVAIDLEVCGARFWLLHGGIPSDLDLHGITPAEVVPWLARTRPADLMWRANDPETMLPVDRPIVMGHRQVREPLDTGEVIAIDTGAGEPDGRLTALLLPERRFLTLD